MEGKSRKIKILIGLIALIVLAFGPFKPKDKNNENANTAEVNLKKVIIGLPGISNQTLEATGIAVNKGYIAEELKKVGYEPEFIYFLKSNGGDVKVFAVDNSRFMYGVLVQNDDNIKSIKDLEGKKVLYRKGTVEQKFFKEILKKYNLDEDKFVSVNAGGADGQSIFSAKEADAAVAIIKALERAKDFAKENPEEVFNIYAQSGIPAEVYKKAYSADLTFSNFDPAITDDTKEKMQKLIDFLYDNQIVKNKITVDDIITTEYYDKYKSSK